MTLKANRNVLPFTTMMTPTSKGKKGGGRVGCRGYGPTDYNHRGCFAPGAAIQNLPEFPYWVDPDPCPAIRAWYVRREKKRQRENALFGWLKGFRNLCPQTIEPDRCARSGTLRRKARRIVKLLGVEQNLKAVAPLPSDFCCGSLRAKIRQIYSPELTLVQELSIKTSAKAETKPCSFCENLQKEDEIEQWKKARCQPVDINFHHLEKFGQAFSRNVPKGWDKRKTVYVPNGHATKDHPRKEGGNWNQTRINEEFEVLQILSSGKKRTITLFAEGNIAALTPLHNSLFSFLEEKGWLLVGSPTEKKLKHLQSGCQGGMWLSFDYVGATDNIKTAYVEEAVNQLIKKAECLSEDEIASLRILAGMSVDGVRTTKLQPMGSPMSFPLLCLINKTIVDMSLTDLMVKGKIHFKEWSGHRCLINGDDLLTKSTSSGDLVESVMSNGFEVGMITNREKTLEHPEYGEINSTVFKNCQLEKKTNVSALWMSADVRDVLGFARESCKTEKGMMAVVTNNVSRLARQKIKTYAPIRHSFKVALLRNQKIRTALRCYPTSEVHDSNLFPVVPAPEGFEIGRERKDELLLERVREVRAGKLFESVIKTNSHNSKKRKEMPVVDRGAKLFKYRGGYMKALKNRPTSVEHTLKIFADDWEKSRMKKLLAAEPCDMPYIIVSDLSRINAFIDEIKTFKDKRKELAHNSLPCSDPCYVRGEEHGTLFGNGVEYVSLF